MDGLEKMSNDTNTMNAMMDHMRTSFHIDIPFTILFEEWKVANSKDAVLSCLVLIAISFVYECIKHTRTHINSVIAKLVDTEKEQKKASPVALIQYQDGCECVKLVDEKKPHPKINRKKEYLSFLVQAKRWLKGSKIVLHIIGCTLYGIETFISFGLMLSVMSYHTGVLASVVGGFVIGKLILSWPGKFTIPKVEEERCH